MSVNCINGWSQGSPTIFGKGQRQLLWTGSRTSRVKTTISSIPNLVNYCVIFIVYNLQTWPRFENHRFMQLWRHRLLFVYFLVTAIASHGPQASHPPWVDPAWVVSNSNATWLITFRKSRSWSSVSYVKSLALHPRNKCFTRAMMPPSNQHSGW